MGNNNNKIAKVGFNAGMAIGSAIRHVRLAAGCCTMAQDQIDRLYPQLDPDSHGAQNLAALTELIRRLRAQLEAVSTCAEAFAPDSTEPEPLKFVPPITPPPEPHP